VLGWCDARTPQQRTRHRSQSRVRCGRDARRRPHARGTRPQQPRRRYARRRSPTRCLVGRTPTRPIPISAPGTSDRSRGRDGFPRGRAGLRPARAGRRGPRSGPLGRRHRTVPAAMPTRTTPPPARLCRGSSPRPPTHDRLRVIGLDMRAGEDLHVQHERCSATPPKSPPKTPPRRPSIADASLCSPSEHSPTPRPTANNWLPRDSASTRSLDCSITLLPPTSDGSATVSSLCVPNKKLDRNQKSVPIASFRQHTEGDTQRNHGHRRA
jgi:hypothetical protein